MISSTIHSLSGMPSNQTYALLPEQSGHFSAPSTLAWGMTRSKVINTEVAVFNHFLWSDRWTWSDRSQLQRGWQPRLNRFLKLNFISVRLPVLDPQPRADRGGVAWRT